ncbi:hypothetical protein Cni_G29352 [Canna indica]|uniref:Reverse transcriptase zinc-binding domain-containing protein n=1 Tax=Canna indica TaxID=4628 RepID=A0AAQ3L469_9LILI|nr:hypothetical protein Cni_G29352 [Canna indica]
MVNSYCCALCGSHQEFISHVLFDCEVAKALWELIEGRFVDIKSILSNLGFSSVPSTRTIKFHSAALALCLNSLYSLWLARNKAIFSNINPCINRLLASTLAVMVHYADIPSSEGRNNILDQDKST